MEGARWPTQTARSLRFGVRAFLLVLCAAHLARAEASVAQLIEQLRGAADFRVRTQAALALGGLDDRSATTPLCQALDDTSDSVRSAAAAALGKLKDPAGLPCLKNHLADANAAV